MLFEIYVVFKDVSKTPTQENLRPSRVSKSQNQKCGQPSKPTIRKEFQDGFGTLGRFPGEKYHILLIDDPAPVIHRLSNVPVHTIPLYK